MTETPVQAVHREMAESAARRRAAWSPAEREIAQAGELTEHEAEEMEAADVAVEQGQGAVYALRRQLAELDGATKWRTKLVTKRGISTYQMVRDGQAVARAQAARPALMLDLAAASNALTVANRERNRLSARIARARGQRRVDAERKLGPAPTKPVSRADPFSRKLGAGFGREAA